MSEPNLEQIDDEITELDLRLTALHNNHDMAVDFITEFALNNLDLGNYDIIIKHLIANRHLHDEVEPKTV